MTAADRPDPRLAALLDAFPDELFTDALYRAGELAYRYCALQLQSLLQTLNLAPRLLDARHDADSLRAAAGAAPQTAPLLDWLLRFGADCGALRRDDGRRYFLAAPPPSPDALARERDALRAELAALAVAPQAASTLNLIDAACAAYPAVLAGTASGEQALLGLDRVPLWLDYFSADNPLYALNNRVAANAAAAACAGRDAPLRILEIGAGAGSATRALLAALDAADVAVSAYRVTEPQAFFRRRGERALKAAYPRRPLCFAALDIDLPWRAQGVDAGGFDLVFGVNVMHVAKDLRFSLVEACRALAADGRLVLGECLRPFPQQPVYPELVFQLLDRYRGVPADPELRPTAGFLTPELWLRACAAAGFEAARIVPDVARIRDIYARFTTGAVCARRGV